MGKWKYLNFLIVLIILFFMFGALITRYHASVLTCLLVALGVILLTLSGYYLFAVKISQNVPPRKPPTTPVQPMNNVKAKARPKVVLKPRSKDNE